MSEEERIWANALSDAIEPANEYARKIKDRYLVTAKNDMYGIDQTMNIISQAYLAGVEHQAEACMITRCVAYMTQRKIPIRDTRAVTRLLASNAGRIDGATNVKVRSYLTDTPAETFQSLETMKQWMGVRKALEYAAIGRIEPDKSSGLAGTPDETGTLIRYFILTFIDRN